MARTKFRTTVSTVITPAQYEADFIRRDRHQRQAASGKNCHYGPMDMRHPLTRIAGRMARDPRTVVVFA